MGATTLDELMTGGTVRRVTRWGEPVLHTPTRPVTEFNDELHELIRDMFATMEKAQGVGLAATQVGVDLALFIYDCPDEDYKRHVGVFCNPVVTLPTGRARNLDSTDEGCLSWPGGYQSLARPDTATCTGQDAFGNPITVTGSGLLARCLQHETDHLGGMVFGDRLSARSRRKLDEQVAQLAHLYPEDWPITPKGRRDDAN
ncbi:peptide deformylase [Luteococcus japonicus]|uniref:Peptide deformylase n=2 Tax=Luteococcus japonicus TaxID=33984 RepID=A0A1R4K841_9ACTN|nr:peptide deformylase [Luteococcus japonicus]ROR55704.1 peptide deformylase [Luteococcus japonicus]SJN40601.1 Peptide deformylase [Luteococcus japonicus LSP_Lj1]